MNIVEKLKDCPTGTKLYSPIFGDCFFDYIASNDATYQIKVKAEEHTVSFLADGRYLNGYNGECMLFPSRDNRDWSSFKIKKEYNFKPFDKVLVRDYDDQCWECNFFSRIDGSYFCCTYGTWTYCIPYEGNEHLVGTTKNPE